MSMIVKVKSMLNIELSFFLSNIISNFTPDKNIHGVNDRIDNTFRFCFDTLLAISPIVQIWMKARRSII